MTRWRGCASKSGPPSAATSSRVTAPSRDQEAQHHVGRDLGGAALPMLAAFDQQRGLARCRVAEPAVIAHPRPGGVAGVAHDQLGDADPPRQLARARQQTRPASAARSRTASNAGRAGNRRQSTTGRSARARSSSIDWRGPSSVVRTPQPVEVFVDIARRDRVARIELAIGRDIVEGQRQPAAPRPDPGAKQLVERDRAADLVAVGQRASPAHAARARRPSKRRDVFDSGIAGPVRFDVGRRQLHTIGKVGHRTILRELRDSAYCARIRASRHPPRGTASRETAGRGSD